MARVAIVNCNLRKGKLRANPTVLNKLRHRLLRLSSTEEDDEFDALVNIMFECSGDALRQLIGRFPDELRQAYMLMDGRTLANVAYKQRDPVATEFIANDETLVKRVSQRVDSADQDAITRVEERLRHNCKEERMLKTLCALIVALVATADEMKDYGIPNWSCDAELMKRSKTFPKSVHSLRPADIDVIAALGDSLTAANGAGAVVNDAVAVLIQYRGLAFGIGGDKSLDEHVTLTNVLRKFNPNLFGYSTGTGSANVWKTAKLNAAIPGAQTDDLVGQAYDLIRRMKDHPEVDYDNSWKLVHIFIGGNDICNWCDHPDVESETKFRDNIGAAVQILKDNMPKTIVVLVGMLDLSLLRSIDKGKYFCDALHTFECPCEREMNFSDEAIREQCKKYMATEQELQDGRFDTTEDFTLVIQPFFEDLNVPPLLPDGEPDLSFFAPDCFHFSAYGHAVVAKTLWNNIMQPVGAKDKTANLTDLSQPLACPDKDCPFIRTTKNSDNCAQYMTPAAN
ncbi:hypothetical protein PRIPAC_91141 [Pristionchus pacificus]|uniref:Lipase n=1 Tax=Pristionchus pacificus TaxID=54126 RepID=A0A2A6CYA8_PRIPA|nr:hypothetical protein PRIPAC_91141 [Pristionchus pacificus]|eukprot:PDM83076.1 lipase [Pristionchus pacificus]